MIYLLGMPTAVVTGISLFTHPGDVYSLEPLLH